MRSTKPDEEQKKLETLRLYKKEHMTQVEAYMATHKCTESYAKKKASEYFKNAWKTLSKNQLLEFYSLDFRHYLEHLASQLMAKKPLSCKGIPTGFEEPDNQTRSAALKELGKIHGVNENKHTEITAEGGDQIHIIIDN